MGFEARGQRCCTVTICHRPQVTHHIFFFWHNQFVNQKLYYYLEF